MCDCEWCGEQITYQHPKLSKKYCSFRCQQAAYRERQKQKSLNIPEDFLIHTPIYMTEDYESRFTYQQVPSQEDKESWFVEDEEVRYGAQELDFTENDDKWGLGESNLTQHSAGDKNIEAAYVKKELKRIFKRKPKP